MLQDQENMRSPLVFAALNMQSATAAKMFAFEGDKRMILSLG